MTLHRDTLNHQWTLFLDRDGVINQRIMGGYVTSVDQFVLMDGAASAIAGCSNIFGRIIVVTNQQGIAKGLMRENDLDAIHQKLMMDVRLAGGQIDAVIHCPDSSAKKSSCRKPGVTMGLKAKRMFPEINFKKSVMLGDTYTDMLFAHRLGMRKILVMNPIDIWGSNVKIHIDLTVPSLSNFYFYITDNQAKLPPSRK